MNVNAADMSSSVTYVESDANKNRTNPGLTPSTDTFLQLLVAQLQYQDPLEPQTDTAFVTQLAQMTTMEQLQQMNLTLSNSQAYGMLGKYVYAEILNSNTGVTETFMGLAESIIIKDGTQYVVSGDLAIPVSKITEVIDPSVIETNNN
ncbi:MAG: flagellar hook assembly protein FlgD [Oscillospiraceae bacterium]|jgi:flagellar basal-body rod modification protein FlgD